MANNSRLVYSSDSGRITEKKKGPFNLAAETALLVRREKKGRGGKTVTTITGLDLNAAQIKELARNSNGSVERGDQLKMALSKYKAITQTRSSRR